MTIPEQTTELSALTQEKVAQGDAVRAQVMESIRVLEKLLATLGPMVHHTDESEEK